MKISIADKLWRVVALATQHVLEVFLYSSSSGRGFKNWYFKLFSLKKKLFWVTECGIKKTYNCKTTSCFDFIMTKCFFKSYSIGFTSNRVSYLCLKNVRPIYHRAVEQNEKSVPEYRERFLSSDLMKAHPSLIFF